MEHRKLRFFIWGTRENAQIFQENKGTGTSPTPGRAFYMFGVSNGKLYSVY